MLESDKATLEIPSPVAGVVKELLVRVGDKVSEGAPIARIEVDGAGSGRRRRAAREGADRGARPRPRSAAPARRAEPAPRRSQRRAAQPRRAAPRRRRGAAALLRPRAGGPRRRAAPRGARAHASPSVRRLARELGVDLALVPPSGPKGRILKEDVQGYVKSVLAKGGARGRADRRRLGGARRRRSTSRSSARPRSSR